MSRSLPCLLLALSTLLAAPARADVKEPPLVTYDDAKANVTFRYPKGWGNIILDDNGSKANAQSEDGQTRLVIESLLEPAKASLQDLLKQRVPTGSFHPQGKWTCRWGDLLDGRHSTFCVKRFKADEVLVCGITATPSHFQLYFHQLIIKICDSATGFRPARD